MGRTWKNCGDNVINTSFHFLCCGRRVLCFCHGVCCVLFCVEGVRNLKKDSATPFFLQVQHTRTYGGVGLQ